MKWLELYLMNLIMVMVEIWVDGKMHGRNV